MSKLHKRVSRGSKELATALAILFAIKASEVEQANAQPVKVVNKGHAEQYRTEKAAHERIEIIDEPVYGDLQVDQDTGVIQYSPDKFGNVDSFSFEVVSDRGGALGGDGDWGFVGLFVIGAVIKAVVGGGSDADPDLFDFGDAPASFGTLLENDGARHQIVNSLKLGELADSDADGVPSALANGDDLINILTDDEDGVIVDNPMKVGEQASFDITVKGEGYLNAWVDFDGDGTFDADEQVIDDLFVTEGVNNITIDVPTDAVSEDTYARFRISSDPGLGPTGLANDGEVEDYQYTILPSFDFGDANFQTTIAQDGANHEINSDLRLGQTIDYEDDGTITSDVDGDDSIGINDEDGLIMIDSFSGDGVLSFGNENQLEVEVSGVTGANAFLSVWVDLNNNNEFDNLDERIYTNEMVVNGVNVLPEIILPDSDGSNINTILRMRLYENSIADPLPTGTILSGEVEDHHVEIINPLDFGDAITEMQTLLADDGARHSHTPDTVRLGSNIDFETNGYPSEMANGDDMITGDDEDGLIAVESFSGSGVLSFGNVGHLEVGVYRETAGTAYVSAWVDLNQDGVFDNTSERIYANEAVTFGADVLTENVLSDFVLRNDIGGNIETTMRLRIHNDIITDPQASGLIVGGEVEDYLVNVVNPLDFGDGPMQTTLDAQDGARHSHTPDDLRLGSIVDFEIDGQSTPDASGDDTLDGSDDEDGLLTIESPGGTGVFTYNETFAMTVDVNGVTGTEAYLSVWLDYNDDGVFDTSERIYTNQAVVNGSNNLIGVTLPDSETGTDLTTLMRMRLYDTVITDPLATGLIVSGEVEDHEVNIVNLYDFGDAAFQTAIAQNGAQHSSTSDFLRLGDLKDYEENGQASVDATGDGLDEDGLNAINPGFGNAPLTFGSEANFDVRINGVVGADPAYLSAWIDFNGNDVFETAERIYTNVAVGNDPDFTLPTITLPNSIDGVDINTEMRIRLYKDMVDDPQATGLLVGGEVEDYIVPIIHRLDFGDAPFQTSLEDNGARHTSMPDGPILGATIDFEDNSGISSDVTMDEDDVTGLIDDEDGVTGVYTTFYGPGFTLEENSFVYIDLMATVNGAVDPRVSAWIDFNGNNMFEANEEVLNDVAVVEGMQQFLIEVDDLGLNADLETYARFRIYDGDNIDMPVDVSPVGLIAGGEVEDYAITIINTFDTSA